MSSEFSPRFLRYDSTISTFQRRLYSTILAEFPWYSEALVLKPESLLAHCEKLASFELFTSSLHGFEDTLLHFAANPHMKDIRGLLGINIVTTAGPDPNCVIVASHESILSVYDFQKICSVLCAYRLFEIICLRAQCISRIPTSTPTACMFLPGPPSTKDDLVSFSRLQEWPSLAIKFRDLVKRSAGGSSQMRTFSNPLFSLMHMAVKNSAATKYLAIEDNFILTAIHIAAMKNIPFGEGTLPDLPANMPFMPPGGFQDEESYNNFEAEFSVFVEKCQTEGCPSSAGHVAARSPFQLAVMISPLYLLVTQRLSTKSFHRRTVIDLAAKLGPHKPPRLLAVENVIWDAVFRLSEGCVSVSTVLRDLANLLPWSDINIALNCDSDKQWFTPRLPVRYNPTTSFPQLVGPSHPIEPGAAAVGQNLALTGTQLSWLSARSSGLPNISPLLVPDMDLTEGTVLSLRNSGTLNVHQQPLLLPSLSFTMRALSSPSPTLSPSARPALHREASPAKDCAGNSFANSLATTLNTAFAHAPVASPSFADPGAPESNVVQHTVNPGELALQSTATSTSDDSRNSGSDAENDDPADAMPYSGSSFDASFDLNDNFQNTENSPNDDGGFRSVMQAHDQGRRPTAYGGLNSVKSDPNEADVPNMTAKNTDNNGSGEFFAGNDSDSSELSSISGDGSDTGSHYGRTRDENTLVGKQPADSPQDYTMSERPSKIPGDNDSPDAASNYGPFKKRAQKETSHRLLGAQSAGPEDPNPPAKRRRSISPRGPGSRDNPIDVDNVASLFEPVVIREYVKKEAISLPVEVNPPVQGGRCYTVFDVMGEPMSFTPSFHFKVYHERFRQFLDRVEALYDHGRPLHIARPDDSIIKSFTYEAWKALTPTQMQQELKKKNVIVTGWPLKESICFNEDGLRKVAGTQSRQISINDYSIKPSSNACGPTVVSGRVRDIWDNRHPSGKTLNALDLPLYDGNTEPTEYASDLHAWDVTRGHHQIDQTSPYPTEHMRWALVGHENAITFVHIDCEGLSTEILVADGGKIWGFLRERPGNPLSSINFFLDDGFHLNQTLRSSNYDFEATALRPRDKLFMLPGQPHFVIGYANSICLGGHYYLTDQMQETLQGLIHSFVLHKFLTNTSHPTRVLLRRMVIFYHMGLIEDEIPDTDPAATHLPDVNSIDGLMNLLSACVLVVLGNVLDFRTYRAPTQEEYTKADKNQKILIDHEINTIPVNERFAICYARGVALHLISWIRHCSVITGPGGDIVADLPSRFFIQIAQTLIKYKEGANASKLDLQANCTLAMLTKQITNVVDAVPHFSSLWLERQSLPSDSLTLAKQDEHSVQWLPDAQLKWSNLPYDFFNDGVTGLDKRYFNAQQDRQQLESSLVIPQLKIYSSASQHSSKRARFG